ncbi:MAG: excinuclease ABC subunit UvrA [Desulfovibrionaceae bacterium]|nr:excinuclease ABC subunit UvrA [Desulfovibrionaceae bacterium]
MKKEQAPFPSSRPCIRVEGARQHNLKNIDVSIPRDELVVLCGPSGSGKSTLAFDIVYAEGQRRYVESLSAYARMFLPRMDKPLVDRIEGLSPAISLEQQTTARNPRSTVGTTTEIYDFLRVFFARLGKTYCSSCGTPIEARATDEIIADIQAMPEGSRVILLAPLVELQKGTHADRLKKLKAEGFVRVRIATQGEEPRILNIDEVPALDKNKRHSLDLVVDRLVIKDDMRTRLADSVELALRYGEGRVIVSEPGRPDLIHATDSVCPKCHQSMPPPSPQLFSFNSPQGACPQCLGIGSVAAFDPGLIAPDDSLSLARGALAPLSQPTTMERLKKPLEALGKRHGFTLSTPLRDFSDEAKKALFHGEPGGITRNGSLRRNYLGGTSLNRETRDEGVHGEERALSLSHWPGVMYLLEKRMQNSDAWSEILSRYSYAVDCPSCRGTRLRPEALCVKVDGLNIQEFCALSISRALDWLKERNFTGRHAVVAEPLLKELTHRLRFLLDVGLDYLSLDRAMSTLSGGEAQRIRLASQLGSGLVGVTYVLDEPSIGLHPRDNERLIRTLRSLQRRGNTVLVVEHDEATIREADTVLELGPGSGSQGGHLVYAGGVDGLYESADTLTARYLRGDMKVPLPDERREPTAFLTLRGVTTNNIKNIDCPIPLGLLTCVTGVSGSGKSSLVMDSLYKHAALHCGLKVEQPGTLRGIDNIDAIGRVVSIDQSPIGRTPRSNPATYTKIFDEIRNIFAMTPDARRRGYTASRFSFNVSGGRCESCRGDGQIRVEMHFLPDIFVTCDVCKGRRFNRETLEVRYKDLNISEVLDLTVSEARRFFANYQGLERRLAVLEDVGLGYVRLGQPATTLSGGEAQRIKISRELGKRSLPDTLYILDEPTTGLHMHEVGKLVTVLHQLVSRGATVVVIEHNTDLILASDYVIDLGPGGGDNGGRILSAGTPEAIMADPASVTGKFLTEERRLRHRR